MIYVFIVPKILQEILIIFYCLLLFNSLIKFITLLFILLNKLLEDLIAFLILGFEKALDNLECFLGERRINHLTINWYQNLLDVVHEFLVHNILNVPLIIFFVIRINLTVQWIEHLHFGARLGVECFYLFDSVIVSIAITYGIFPLLHIISQHHELFLHVEAEVIDVDHLRGVYLILLVWLDLCEQGQESLFHVSKTDIGHAHNRIKLLLKTRAALICDLRWSDG